MRDRIARALNLVMFGIVVILALGSVWPFGSVLPFFQWILFAGIALLLATWGLRALVEGRVLWKSCPVVTCLAALSLLTMLQIVPLPKALVTHLSDTTALRAKLLPSAEEIGVEKSEETTATLSLAPGVTRLELLRLIAVLALFAAVRNNLLAPWMFYWLGWLLAANGVILALVGMGQLTSSPRNVVFWSVPTQGQVFGPFICRNHAAYYLNLCLGLTAGLLLGTRYFLTSDRATWRGMFRDARILWLISGIGIMLAGLLATLSRGGLIGLALGVFTCFLLLLLRFGKRRVPWIGGGLILGLSTLLILWYGSDRVSERWEKLGGENSTPAARVDVWARTLPLVWRYPLFGTGLGTFGYVEQTCRNPGDYPYVYNDHAHNDFLELWIEGGTLQLLLVLAIICLVFRKGYLAFSQHGDTGLGRLALGALIAFVAIVAHSFVDFGMHIPAVAVLTAIVGGMLMNLADMPVSSRSKKPKPPPPPPPSRGWAGLEAASLCVVAWFLVSAGWRDQQAERYLWASSLAPALDTKISYLEEATKFAPDRAELYFFLADRHVKTYLEKRRIREWADAAALVAACSGARYPGALAFCDRSEIRVSEEELETANALLVRACQENPLLYLAQEGLERISTIGSLNRFKGQRLDRLVFLSPSDPAPWFWAGQQALRVGDKDKAYRSLRNSLTAEKKFLPDIVKLVPEKLSPTELLHDVLPSDPALVLAAAEELGKNPENSTDRTPFYKESLRLLEEKGGSLTGVDWMSKAKAYEKLGDDASARKSYELALDNNPTEPFWRYEYCKLLYRTGDLKETQQQLNIVLFHLPHYSEAGALRNKVLKDLAAQD